jgi:hypothetical protein
MRILINRSCVGMRKKSRRAGEEGRVAAVAYAAALAGASGSGREWGPFGLEDCLEVKAVMGYTPRV